MIKQSEPIFRLVCDKCKTEGPGASSDLAARSAGRAEGWFSLIFGRGPAQVDYCSPDCLIDSGLIVPPGFVRRSLKDCPYCRQELFRRASGYFQCPDCHLTVHPATIGREQARQGEGGE